MSSLDRLDLQLLDLVQQDNLQTADQLSERVGRSPSAVARRLRRLRRTGAIVADVSLVSEEAAGQPLFAVVHVQLEQHEPRDADQFRRRLVSSANVQLCLDVSGAFDMMVIIVAADMDGFNVVANALFMEQAAVRRFETTFVKKRSKVSFAVPLAELKV